MGGADDSIYVPYMGHTICLFGTIICQLSNCTQNERFGVPSQYEKCDDVLQWETPIAYEMFQSLLYMYKADVRCSWQHLPATCGSHLVIFTEEDSQNVYIMPDFGYILSTANGMMYYEEKHPLLMKCFRTFLRCISQMEAAYGSILLPWMGPSVSYHTNVDSQIAYKMKRFWVSS